MRRSLFAATLAGVTMLGIQPEGIAQENADQKLGTVHG